MASLNEIKIDKMFKSKNVHIFCASQLIQIMKKIHLSNINFIRNSKNKCWFIRSTQMTLIQQYIVIF